VNLFNFVNFKVPLYGKQVTQWCLGQKVFIRANTLFQCVPEVDHVLRSTTQYAKVQRCACINFLKSNDVVVYDIINWCWKTWNSTDRFLHITFSIFM